MLYDQARSIILKYALFICPHVNDVSSANLCKLPYINDPTISSPMERVGRCQYLITALGQKEGLRGWYAKVVEGGVIRIGSAVALA